MIKRRFYKRGHGDDSSSSSSSDSDSDSIPQVEEAEEDGGQQEEVEEEVKEHPQQQLDEGYDDDQVEDERAKASVKKKNKKKRKKTKSNKDGRSSSPGSGYQSEDSSVNEVNLDSSDLPASDEEEDSIEKDVQNINGTNFKEASRTEVQDSRFSSNDPTQPDLPDCVLKCKSVFKCKLCPRIVCLSEETVRAHLSSKRHSRSKKLLDEGRLKLMLNSEGEIEEDQETHAERHTRTVALAQEPAAPAKKDKGRQRQNRRRKKRMRTGSNKRESELAKDPAKKQCKARV